MYLLLWSPMKLAPPLAKARVFLRDVFLTIELVSWGNVESLGQGRQAYKYQWNQKEPGNKLGWVQMHFVLNLPSWMSLGITSQTSRPVEKQQIFLNLVQAVAFLLASSKFWIFRIQGHRSPHSCSWWPFWPVRRIKEISEAIPNILRWYYAPSSIRINDFEISALVTFISNCRLGSLVALTQNGFHPEWPWP